MAAGDRRPRRAGRPRVALKGSDRAIHEFIHHLRGLVEHTGTSLVDIAAECGCSSTTVSKRLNGEVLPEWTFVDKLVRACTPVEKQEARLSEMRRRWVRANQEAGRVLVADEPEPSGTQLYTRLVEAQAQTIHAQSQLFDVHNELAMTKDKLVESVRAEVRTSQMVYVLHIVIGRLNDVIVRLTDERNQYLAEATHHRGEVERINTQVSTALSDRERAERQLQRARAEKKRATALAEAAQARIDQLERELRDVHVSTEPGLGHSTGAAGSEPARSTPDADEVLLDTSRGLDRMQRLLDDQGDELDRLDLSLVSPPGVDLERPSLARVYDYYLGGTANWAVDREFADRALARFPLVKDIALANRLFLQRVVRFLIKRGVRQFLDIGAGVPTEGNTHQVADDVKREAGQAPDVRVVYVDNEPVAVTLAATLLDSEGDPARHVVIEADLRDPDALWQKALATDLLDLNEPIALLLIAVLHVHQPGADGNDIGPQAVARFRELLPMGSYLAISHVTNEGVPAEFGEKMVEVKRMYDESSNSNVIPLARRCQRLVRQLPDRRARLGLAS